jgi:hypothetical protein
MCVLNRIDRFNLATDLIDRVPAAADPRALPGATAQQAE